MTVLNSVFGLLIALGILVTIHEYGHFWVARKCGVKVLRFSVGFGRPLWLKKDKYGTEFAIAWIPLGGYVKMLDEREADVAPELLDQTFNRKSPLQKIAIVLAGPIANILFAIVAFSLMYLIGVRDLVPIIDTPNQGSAAEVAQLQRGDEILRVDGKTIASFTDLNLASASRVGDSGDITLTVLRKNQAFEVSLPINAWLANEQSPNPLQALGLSPMLPHYSATLGQLDPAGAAARDGLLVGDTILSVNGEAVDGWFEWVDRVQQNPETSLQLVVDRNGAERSLELTPAALERDGKTIGFVGAAVAPVEWPDEQLITTRYWPPKALLRGVQDSYEMISLSYQMLWKMITGKVSLKQIGGPISMAQMAGVSVTSGAEVFIGFLAFISISLAIVNLLPVPVLDGGHVLIHSYELITRKELSERALTISMQLGMAFIFSLMAVAFFNDVSRIF